MTVNLELRNAFQPIAEHRGCRTAVELSRRAQSAPSLRLGELKGQLGLAVVSQLALAKRRPAGLRLSRITDPPLLRELGILPLHGVRPSPAVAALLALPPPVPPAKIAAMPLPSPAASHAAGRSKRRSQ